MKKKSTSMVKTFLERTKLNATEAGAEMGVCYMTVRSYLTEDEGKMQARVICNMLAYLNKKNIKAAVEWNSKTNSLELKIL